MMRLKFKTSEGEQFVLDVSEDDTLQEINLEIQKRYGFHISIQTLSFNGAIIATDNDLQAARLTDGCRLRLHVPAGTRIVRPSTPSGINPGYLADHDSDDSSVYQPDVGSPENPTATEVDGDGNSDLDVGSSKKNPPSEDHGGRDAKRIKLEVLPEQTVKPEGKAGED